MGDRTFPRITGCNTNGGPGRLVLLMNLLNSREHMNDIYVLNDIRIQENESHKVSLKNHNMTIANDIDNDHTAEGCAILTPKDNFVTVLETGHAEALLCKIQRRNKTIVVGTH